MTPYIDTFIVQHEQTANNSPGSIEVDPISMSDVLIISGELGCDFIVPYKMIILILFLNFLLLIFLLLFFLLNL